MSVCQKTQTVEEEQQPRDDDDDGPYGTDETRKKRLALFIRQKSTSLSLVKAGAVNKQTIHCQREMAEVTDAAGEKSKSWIGNSLKVKEPACRHKHQCTAGFVTAHVV